MSDKLYDVIVIGGGPAAAHVSEPLVREGFSVVMVDGGILGQENEIEGDFDKVRKSSSKQREFFLGKNLSDIVPSNEAGGHSVSMTGGVKSHVSSKVQEILPIQSPSVSLVQSLAKGGLTEAWGGACDTFSDEEIASVGMPVQEMHEAYQEVINMVGISGQSEYHTQGIQKIDLNAKNILDKYRRSSNREFIVSEAMLAFLTKDLGGRKANTYRDLDYWTNDKKSLYRAKFTIEDLQKKKNFSYYSNNIATKIISSRNFQKVCLRDISKNNETELKAKYVIVAAGAINTLRILAQSFNLYESKIPFLIKPHVLVPCLNLSSLGKVHEKNKHSLCQLFVRDTESKHRVSRSFTQIYSYKSLLLFKLLGFSPFSAPESFSLLSKYTPSFVIADIRFPSFRTNDVSIFLERDKKTMSVDFSESAVKNSYDLIRLKSIKRFLRNVGLIPLKTVFTPLGSTAHYAGGAYFCDRPVNLFSTKEDGSLWKNNRIYLADSSTWKVLPPKPPALTIMANARRIGKGLVKKLKIANSNDNKQNRKKSRKNNR